ncbi:hypothetical protein [Pseudomonas anguilliseptica]|uniref:phage tail fiber protein n=1 Tax=Pseudomonas anguilliseptica TaxID=53406 RepID=UPI0022B07BAC|nr:hypothetical protein [Pseudomonas anguilliseptica]MCZ4321461.1 hypothetical protein [Pseudomonas anguilliseptica]
MTTTYLSDQIITSLFGGTKYISEHTANPGATGANEVTTGVDSAYVRRAAALSKSLDGNFYRARNSADISFPAAGAGASYSVTHIGVWDALTGGNCLAVAPVTGGAIPVVAGTINTFAANDIVVRGE